MSAGSNTPAPSKRRNTNSQGTILMARKPRQEPIGFYGQFTPTGVDQSGARRMQALAGLAEQVGGMVQSLALIKQRKKLLH